ncbi:MAG: hypothetical protein ACK5LC_12230 [Coprobacillaceae bacterium]
MESEFLDKEDSLSTKKTYTEIFKEVFPYYISIGMTYDQFWDDDVELVIYYREAERFRSNRHNTESWLQGMYIYDAVGTIIYNAFGRKRGQQAASYVDKPYSIHQKDIEEEKQQQVEEERAKAKVWMNNLVNSHK